MPETMRQSRLKYVGTQIFGIDLLLRCAKHCTTILLYSDSKTAPLHGSSLTIKFFENKSSLSTRCFFLSFSLSFSPSFFLTRLLPSKP